MKPQSAKAKGRRLQQQVVNDLLTVFPHLSQEDIRSTSMGAGGEDILLSHAARKSIPFSFEAKNQERVNIWSSIEQAKTNCPDGIDPAVVFKKNNENPHVVLSWKTFLKLLNPDSDIAKNKEELHEISKQIARIAAKLA
tara:strand:- start:239 stop:655 length:417 start_codon:yes stop_codon:yes gene_type:complete